MGVGVDFSLVRVSITFHFKFNCWLHVARWCIASHGAVLEKKVLYAHHPHTHNSRTPTLPMPAHHRNTRHTIHHMMELCWNCCSMQYHPYLV